MAILWDPKLNTGIEVIDHQHQRIVSYINQLEVAKESNDKAAIGEVIEQLVDYTQSHFGFEEAMMEQAGYPFLKPHQKVHELFIRRVSDFTMRAAKGEDVVDELHLMLAKWLINHIANEDRDYAKIVLHMLAQQDKPEVPVPTEEKQYIGFLGGLLRKFFH